MRILKFITGMFIGATLGAVIVLLIAPQSGEETQMMVTEKLDALKDEAKKAFDTRKMDLEKQISDLQGG